MVLEKSARIRLEADSLLKEQGIENLLRRFGDVIYTGSYALDLMVWNDIDLYLVPKPNTDWTQCASDVCAALVARADVDTVRIEKSFWRQIPVLPRGIYIGVKIPAPDYPLPWKLDIWMVDEATRASNKKLVDDILARLDASKKELIVRSKAALITPAGRTPSHTSVHVYQAVLEKGLTCVDDVVAYVEKLGDEHRRKTQIS